MLSLIILRNSCLKGCTINKAQVLRCLSEKILSIKPTLIRNSFLSQDVRLFGVSKIQLSSLRSKICKQNGEISFTKRNPDSFSSIRGIGSNSLDVNTNVLNNVFLYKYEKPKFFIGITIFSIVQLVFWTGISIFTYTETPKRDPYKESLTQYLSKNMLNITTIVLGIIVGFGAAALISCFTMKSVKYIILNKGGNSVTFVLYHPWKSNSFLNVNLNQIHCKTARKEMRNYLPVKIYGRPFYYILDSDGEFVNPTLFDYTVGIKRA